MALYEPLTDGAKAFRHLIRTLRDLAAMIGKIGNTIERRRSREMARYLSVLHFDERVIPELLSRIASSASNPAGKELRRQLRSLDERLRDTEFEVLNALSAMRRMQDFLRERFGIGYSNWAVDRFKGDIRERMADFRYKIDLQSLDDAAIRNEALAIQEMITEFNETIRYLHDQLLGIKPPKLTKPTRARTKKAKPKLPD